MSTFNNEICFKNIMYLYKLKGFKIGEFESKINASIGYFSRLVKEEGKMGTISSEILFNAANVLNIPVEILGSEDLTELDSTEKYIFDFLNKICNKTNENEINWAIFNKDYLDNYKSLSSLVTKKYNSYDSKYYNFYKSEFWDDREFTVNLLEDIFIFETDKGIFMLTNIEANDNSGNSYNGYEFYFKDFNKNEKNKICHSSFKQKPCLNKSLELLFKSVINYIKKPKIDENVRLAIDEFMNN